MPRSGGAAHLSGSRRPRYGPGMSSLRAIELPTQQLHPLQAVETEAYLRPRRPAVPVWAARIEETIRITARLGYSPTPTIVLVSILTIAASLRAR
jgi:hypothetical protein